MLGEFARQRGVRRSGPHHEVHLDSFTRSTPQDAILRRAAAERALLDERAAAPRDREERTLPELTDRG